MSIRKDYISELLALAAADLESADIRWQSPSNIALVKYWGKHGNQLPINPSISFTLSKCISDTRIKFTRKPGPSTTVDLNFMFEEKPAPAFAKRMIKFLEDISDVCPFVKQYNIEIESSNSFPHSAGIASSASGFSAVGLCLASIEDLLYSNLDEDAAFRKKASYLARLGSGSACRSIFGEASWWGESSTLPASSDYYAVEAKALLHNAFTNFQDTIIVVSADEKPVSSTHGHGLMDFHPYREGRLQQADQHLLALKSALGSGDLERFGLIVENEALSLHALMMSSSPGYFLITGNTIEAIQAIRAFRASDGVPCYFTLDAGPNIHLLYPSSYVNQVKDFIANELKEITDHVIFDEMGNGPIQLS